MASCDLVLGRLGGSFLKKEEQRAQPSSNLLQATHRDCHGHRALSGCWLWVQQPLRPERAMRHARRRTAELLVCWVVACTCEESAPCRRLVDDNSTQTIKTADALWYHVPHMIREGPPQRGVKLPRQHPNQLSIAMSMESCEFLSVLCITRCWAT